MPLMTRLRACELEHAIITAHPFDLSGGKVQAGIKKVPAVPAYRKIITADSEAQELGLQRGKMMAAAVKMGKPGLPNAEFVPGKTHFPCDYCEWKTRCQVLDKGDFGMVFPAIPYR